MKINELKPVFCETIGENLEDGILYISEKYNIAIHRCACGCGIETVTPFNRDNEWIYTNNNGIITLRPSIGNQQFPCRSHYFITNNKIDWL